MLYQLPLVVRRCTRHTKHALWLWSVNNLQAPQLQPFIATMRSTADAVLSLMLAATEMNSPNHLRPPPQAHTVRVWRTHPAQRHKILQPLTEPMLHTCLPSTVQSKTLTAEVSAISPIKISTSAAATVGATPPATPA